ncbi:mitochondrial carrier domain-containing protein [Entophlyctis helioformis]|nr:mitochondrial carrier domain-containing protein [Entophlyctis helioformis]
MSQQQGQPSGKTVRPPPSFWVHFMAGAFGGTVGAAITCPLEVVKTRLQSSYYRAGEAPFSFKNPLQGIWSNVTGVVDVLRNIKQREGVRALWKGLGPNLIGVVPARAIYFSVYSQGKHFYSMLNNNRETSLVHLVSAATAGSATAACTNPIWVVKTRMQLQSEDATLRVLHKYKNSFHCAYLIAKEEGFMGLYRGLSASVLGLAESTFQFVMYEYFKKVAMDAKLAEARINNLPTENVTLDWTTTFVSAATAKLIAALATYPHEVIRTRLRQTPVDGVRKYTGLLQSAKLIYKEEGMAALYGGMTAHLMRVVPNAAILFFCYEMVVSLASSAVSPQTVLSTGFSKPSSNSQ